LLIATFLHDASLDRFALVGRERLKEPPHPFPGLEILEPCDHIVVKLKRRHAELSPSAVLNASTTASSCELVPRDPEQPCSSRRSSRLEALHAEQGGRERLGRKIGGELGVSYRAEQVFRTPSSWRR
jgi:hypothetical protein